MHSLYPTCETYQEKYMTNHCKAITKKGEHCKSHPLKGKDYCFIHDPENKDKRALALSQGGQTPKKIQVHLDPININTQRDVVLLLCNTINNVRSGCMPPRIANSVGYLAGHLLKALEASDLEKRVEQLEKTLNK